MTRKLDGREYKLLLDPDSVGAEDDAVGAFYADRLRDIIRRAGRKVEGRFGKPRHRAIRFFDTEGAGLDAAGYALRARRPAGSKAEVTLKLRLPDLFVVAGTDLRGRDDNAETTFEEDIGPLEVASDHGPVTIAEPLSIRSRFALSTRQPLRGDLDRLRDAFEHYPTLRALLGDSAPDLGSRTRLLSGPAVDERVFRGPVVRFGGDTAAEIVISLWRLAPPAAIDRVAEISYRCETVRGAMRGRAARAALDLFLAFQRELDVELRYPSKTKLALPGSAAAPPRETMVHYADGASATCCHAASRGR